MTNQSAGSEPHQSAADSGARGLTVMEPLRVPVIRAAIEALNLPRGSNGLDAGCGIGLQTVALARAVGPAGRVTGLDLHPALLDHARTLAARQALSERVSYQQGDVRELPFEDDQFDWAWSADCVGYAPLEPLPLIRELARVVRPGGTVAILAWSSEALLPGYPHLEALLRGTTAGLAPFSRSGRPERHFLRALGWFRAAGLHEPRARTFAGSAHAPLEPAIRQALVALFEMRWPGVESELDSEALAAFRRLCLPGSPDFLPDHPDYVAFYTYTLFQGSVVGAQDA